MTTIEAFMGKELLKDIMKSMEPSKLPVNTRRSGPGN